VLLIGELLWAECAPLGAQQQHTRSHAFSSVKNAAQTTIVGPIWKTKRGRPKCPSKFMFLLDLFLPAT